MGDSLRNEALLNCRGPVMTKARRKDAARPVGDGEREHQPFVSKIEEVGSAVGLRLGLETGNRTFVIGRELEFTSLERH